MYCIFFRPALLYPAIPEVQMEAIMKAGETIREIGLAKDKDKKPANTEEPLRLKSISEYTQEKHS